MSIYQLVPAERTDFSRVKELVNDRILIAVFKFETNGVFQRAK